MQEALEHAILHLLPILRIHHFRTDPPDLSKLPGKRADPVGRSVYDNADDVHMFLFIWKSHSSDNIGAVIVKDLVDLPTASLFSTMIPTTAILVSCSITFSFCPAENISFILMSENSLCQVYTVKLFL